MATETAPASDSSGEVLRILSARSHYEVLGNLHRQSSDDDVRKAYRQFALKTHPDKNKHERAEEAFKRVHGAFQALETQEKRNSYDRRGGTGFQSEDDASGFGGGGGFARGSEFDFFDMFMGGSRGARSAFGGMGIDMNELFTMMLVEEMLRSKYGGSGTRSSGFGGGGGGGFSGFRMGHSGGFHSGFYDEESFDEFDEDEDEEDEEEDYDDDDDEFIVVDTLLNKYFCECCGVHVAMTERALHSHIYASGHRNRAAQLREARPKPKKEEADVKEEEEDEEDFDVLDEEGITFDTKSQEYICTLCNVRVPDLWSIEDHVFGKRHEKALEKLHAPKKTNKSAGGAPAKADQVLRCLVCNVVTPTQKSMDEHMMGKKHAANERKRAKESS